MPVHILTHFVFMDSAVTLDGDYESIKRHINMGGRAYLRKAQELAQQFANQTGWGVQASKINVGAAPGLVSDEVVAIVYPESWSG